MKGVKNMRQRALKRDGEDRMKGRKMRGEEKETEDDVLEVGTSAFSPNTA